MIHRYTRTVLLGAAGVLAMLSPAFSEQTTTMENYLDKALSNNETSISSEKRIVSFVNNIPDNDSIYLISFMNAFKWATGVGGSLIPGAGGKIVFIYLNKINDYNENQYSDPLLKEMYIKNFIKIKESGSCTRVVARNNNEVVKEAVFIDINSDLDFRIDCLYRNYRSSFGINISARTSNISDNFIMDLRIARCLQTTTDRLRIRDNFKQNTC